MKCPEGRFFDVDSETCNWPPKGSCKTFFGPDCTYTSVYFPDPNDRNGFFQCANGQFVKFKCPTDLMFNKAVNVCDWPKNVVGSGNETQNVSSSVMTIEVPSKVPPKSPEVPSGNSIEATGFNVDRGGWTPVVGARPHPHGNEAGTVRGWNDDESYPNLVRWPVPETKFEDNPQDLTYAWRPLNNENTWTPADGRNFEQFQGRSTGNGHPFQSTGQFHQNHEESRAPQSWGSNPKQQTPEFYRQINPNSRDPSHQYSQNFGNNAVDQHLQSSWPSYQNSHDQRQPQYIPSNSGQFYREPTHQYPASSGPHYSDQREQYPQYNSSPQSSWVQEPSHGRQFQQSSPNPGQQFQQSSPHPNQQFQQSSSNPAQQFQHDSQNHGRQFEQSSQNHGQQFQPSSSNSGQLFPSRMPCDNCNRGPNSWRPIEGVNYPSRVADTQPNRNSSYHLLTNTGTPERSPVGWMQTKPWQPQNDRPPTDMAAKDNSEVSVNLSMGTLNISHNATDFFIHFKPKAEFDDSSLKANLNLSRDQTGVATVGAEIRAHDESANFTVKFRGSNSNIN